MKLLHRVARALGLTWTGRRGVIMFEAVGGGLLNKGVSYRGAIEVREIERSGTLSKISIDKVSGAPSSVAEYIPEWLKTDDIKWLEEDIS